MRKRPVIHVLQDIHPEAMALIADEAELLDSTTPFPSHCDAVIVRTSKVTAEHMDQCPNLKVIGKHGVGLDAIDVAAAQDKGITVLSTPGANAESVADLAVGLALALIRNIHPATLATTTGKPFPPADRDGWDLAELQAGIFGLGFIGRATAKRLMAGFGASVRAFDPGLSAADWPNGIGRAETLADLLATTQLLFIHAPLLPATHHALNAETLTAMPKGSYVVNCARGGIVDEVALADALRSGHIAGAALDVFEQEPPAADNPLFSCPGFLGTPHLGASTRGTMRRVGLSIARQVLDQLQNG